jgi:hypothetical protein
MHGPARLGGTDEGREARGRAHDDPARAVGRCPRRLEAASSSQHFGFEASNNLSWL